MDKEVAKIYGNKVRVRACGIYFSDDKLLMVNHRGVTANHFWSPPGGGVEFGQSIKETLEKEFIEETGLSVTAGEFLFGCEYINKPIHSIELFYAITDASGRVKTGRDPEIKFLTAAEIQALRRDDLHGIFQLVSKPNELKELRGFFRI
jgi:8-oxo-dGTP diphosphatase